MRNILLLYSLCFFSLFAVRLHAQRSECLLDKNWKFMKGEVVEAVKPEFDDSNWEAVNVPHDWAIFGPFDRNHDLQEVAVTQNLEKQASVKTGRTGGLPYVGVGWYRTTFDAPADKRTTLIFDGAMSEARVYINGQVACFWPFGYNSFYLDATPYIYKDGTPNILAVRLENRPQSSRWYPGAGLYRNVRLVTTESVHVPVWGTQLTTPHVAEDYASVRLRTMVAGAGDKNVRIATDIFSHDGKVVAAKDDTRKINHGQPFEQNFLVNAPSLWSPETPYLYKAVSKIYVDGKQVDEYTTRFGIRSIEIVADKGFFLNGKHRKFQGVCNHHDLGPLGAAVNVAALRRQLTLLKDMGCDAIRTSHNMPAPELVELCDEMGFMMMIEPFDEWDIAKCGNGYHRYFDEWAEKDMVNMLRHYRNNPCVVMWSIGNEVPTQCSPEGYKVASFLQDICHREDPTRPVTCGMDQVSCVLSNGFAAMIDVPGFNYRAHRYVEAYENLPQNIVLGSETASTVSSRGVYKFPVELKKHVMYDDHQSSGYDTEACSWSNVPDEDFALADDYNWTIGQFVWTGFDYLGEPSPYDTDAWPSHSSLFGIIDLASLPKDRYYLYRSLWNKQANTLHVLPHWTWPGRERENTPVFVYTNYPEAELFVNGKSYGKQRKLTVQESKALQGKDSFALQRRYRLMWMDVPYQPGEVKVVAYDASGKPVEEKVIHTAGKPHHLELVPDRTRLAADGKDLAYITVRVVDKDGNLCPTDSRMVNFSVKGSGKYRAAANGDAVNLNLFHLPNMPAFSGQLTVIVQSGEQAGEITLEAKAKGLKTGKLVLHASAD
nr:beta-galactosidase GalB [uncultured Bacteroides sp.]